MSVVDAIVERGVVPEAVLRAGIRANLALRLRSEYRKGPADRRAYASYAETERQKDYQNVDVSFDQPDPPDR